MAWYAARVPRAGQLKPRDRQRLTDHVALGVLTATFPPSLVDAVIEATGTREQRHRLLPARLVVYYVLAMSLFPHAGYEEVLRSLTEGLAWVSGWTEHWEVPSQVAISKARARLGRAPLVELFSRACTPLATKATPATKGAFYRGLRVVSIDGTTLDNGGVFGECRHLSVGASCESVEQALWHDEGCTCDQRWVHRQTLVSVQVGEALL